MNHNDTVRNSFKIQADKRMSACFRGTQSLFVSSGEKVVEG